jgi:type IX secretion system PorP/SprF family membrane protein
MKMKKHNILILIFFCLSKLAISQDPFFSQFQSSPMTFNPALLGYGLVKDARISFITRNQWWGGSTQPYTTNTVSLEKRLGGKSLEKDQFVLGLMFLNERSNGGILSNTFASGGLTYRNSLDALGNEVLSGGLTVSYSNRMIDLTNATFQNQFGSFGFMQSANNYDPISTLTNKYIDMSLGIAYESKSEKVSYMVGGSLFHASKPTAGVFNNTKYSIDPRLVLHGTVKFTSASKADWGIDGNVQMQGAKQLFTIGTTYSQPINSEATSKAVVGVYERFGESLYPYLGMHTAKWKFGVSYDIIQSEVKTTFNSIQSFEASFVLEFGN